MALSSIVKQNCKVCGKVAIEKSRFSLGSKKVISLECGHVTTEDTIIAKDYNFTSLDGRSPMPFQVENIKFLENCNGRGLIADEQGLGKTFSACGLLYLHQTELLPAVIATKTTLKRQWMQELFKIVQTRKVQIINSSKAIAIPGFDVYVTTYDLMEHVAESLNEHEIEIKTLIVDECQAIKNHLTARAKNIQKLAVNIPYIIGLSGTPIKNNAGEYFTILNLLQPKRFPEFTRYLRDYCDSYETMYGYKVGGLSSIDNFMEDTKDFITRKTQKEVLPDLFALKMPRKFQYVEFDKKFRKAYERGVSELEELMYREDSSSLQADKMAIRNRLRQLTGLSKAVECVDLVTDHILSTGRKIIVFAHHHSVVDLLENNLNSWLKDGGYNPCVLIRAGDNGTQRVEQFSKDNTPICIASTLASGEGLDGLQRTCSDMILLERQWNPSNEEQVEGRIGRIGQTKPVNFIYMIAGQTIDEWFTELVEQKRSYISGALDGIVTQWNENDLMKELDMKIISEGRKKWSI